MGTTWDVVIPTFNRGLMVLDALRSALSQSAPPASAIVVDDGSSDASAIEVSASAAAIGGDTLLLSRNGGVSRARNKGARFGAAPWILFLDSDDMVCDDAIPNLIRAGRDADVISGRFRRVDRDSNVGPSETLWNGEDLGDILATRNVIGPSWTLVRRAAFTAIGGFDERLRTCEDWKFYRNLQKAGATFRFSNTDVAYYRAPPGARLMDDKDALERDAKLVMTDQ